MKTTDRVYVAGHRGLVGSAIVRKLEEDGYSHVITRTREQTDLRDRQSVDEMFASERPTHVFVAAARVGGILANSTYPADFIRDNLAIELNLIDAAHRHGVEKLVFLGSSCIYPKHAPQPMKEEHLLTGTLEPTNAPYAIAKIAGVEMCRAYNTQYGTKFVSAMPTNLYGPGDNFDLQTSHVLPALIRKLHEAKERGDAEVVLWGTGTPKREFLHVDDLADGCVFLMQRDDAPDLVNIGVGEDLSIAELANVIAGVVGYRGRFVYDTTKPDGTPRKLLDVSRMSAMGWQARIPLTEGIRQTYDWFRTTVAPAASYAST